MPLDTSVFDKIRTFADYQRADEEFQRRKQLADLQAFKMQQGAELPAAIQIANEYAKARAAGDTQRMNDIALAAKSFDKGVVMGADGTAQPIQGYGAAVGGIDATKKGMTRKAEQDVNLATEPQIARDTALAEGGAKNDVKRNENLTKAQSALTAFKQQTDLVTSTIDKALNTVSRWSTGYGTIFSKLPNTDARKLENYLNTIKANVGFDKLQTMRDNSPTGGALGNVSEFENELLQAVNGPLDPAQSDQLVEDLKGIKELYVQVLADRTKAFNQDYGKFAKPSLYQKSQQEFNARKAPPAGGTAKFLGFE